MKLTIERYCITLSFGERHWVRFRYRCNWCNGFGGASISKRVVYRCHPRGRFI